MEDMNFLPDCCPEKGSMLYLETDEKKARYERTGIWKFYIRAPEAGMGL